MSLQSEHAGGVLTLRLDRPGHLNAVDEPTAAALLAALGAAETAADVPAVVLRGNGRAACAGPRRRRAADAGDRPHDPGVADRHDR